MNVINLLIWNSIMLLKIIAAVVGLVVGVTIGAVGAQMIGFSTSTTPMISSTVGLIFGAIGWKLASKG